MECGWCGALEVVKGGGEGVFWCVGAVGRKMQRVGAGVRMAWSSRAAMRERGMYQRMRIDEDDQDDQEASSSSSSSTDEARRMGMSPIRALQKWLHRALGVVPVFTAAPVVPLSESPKRELRMQRSTGKASSRSKKHHQDRLYFPRRWC